MKKKNVASLDGIGTSIYPIFRFPPSLIFVTYFSYNSIIYISEHLPHVGMRYTKVKIKLSDGRNDTILMFIVRYL